jgi:hypothetical protein
VSWWEIIIFAVLAFLAGKYLYERFFEKDPEELVAFVTELLVLLVREKGDLAYTLTPDVIAEIIRPSWERYVASGPIGQIVSLDEIAGFIHDRLQAMRKVREEKGLPAMEGKLVDQIIQKWMKEDLVEKIARILHDDWIRWSAHLAAGEKISEERLGSWRKSWVKFDDLDPQKKQEFKRSAERYIAAFAQFLAGQ